ncbi:phosphoglucosamine mutase [Paraeggerthella hongkongensis]|uniref:phosphoglucosamine mutase n=1 Tax=Paraeggerthella TaxID=651554 RepID=UPI001C10D6F5|nr:MULTISPECIES: phosphoglucosamine mutase [Paraeggerthella]MBU5405102.1 phosphoglucosamine mutase [Paraeggerthella hongkongensis]MCD2432806.1 phosphoglucosamine mutase [Paraeggerthella hominis]
MARLFGTDGVRGIANTELTCDLAFKLGQAAVAFQGKTILIGKDTRLSGDMLESSVAAGVMSMGGTALLAGIIPTPAIALLVRELHCDGGVVISASHNPPEYNGIKLFDAQGFKLPDAVEDDIEAFVVRGGAAAEELPAGDAVGVSLPVEDACELYIAHAVSTVTRDGIDLAGLKVALDVGHGASCMTSAEALRRLGADVVVVNEDFDGTDINVQCGSTHLGPVRDLVAEIGADVGIAHDGDADRVMLVDARGNEIDGDVVETVCAIDLKQRGLLPGNTAVSTVMCNLGLTHALRDAGIELIQTKVGDRYVLEAMREGGFVVGGEQSGHMIFLEHNSTGDGLVTALQFLAACKRAGKSVEEAASVMTRFPQTLINVKVQDKHAVDDNDAVQAAVRAAEDALGDSGRVLLRPSGTEPVVRVMVEAASAEDAERHAAAIAAVVEREV